MVLMVSVGEHCSPPECSRSQVGRRSITKTSSKHPFPIGGRCARGTTLCVHICFSITQRHKRHPDPVPWAMSIHFWGHHQNRYHTQRTINCYIYIHVHWLTRCAPSFQLFYISFINGN